MLCLFAVRSSDKRIARDEEFSDSEDEGEGGRKNASTNKEDGPQKKRAKTVTPIPKPVPIEDTKVDKKEEDKQVAPEPEKPTVESKEDILEKKEEAEAEKAPARFLFMLHFQSTYYYCFVSLFFSTLTVSLREDLLPKEDTIDKTKSKHLLPPFSDF